LKIYQLKPKFAKNPECFWDFDIFLNGVDPAHYVRVWDGDIDTDDVEKIYGHFYLNPPEEYHGNPLSPGDVLEINGDHLVITQGMLGIDLQPVEFDPTGVKPQLYVEYGYGPEADSSNAMPIKYAKKAAKVGIPIGIDGGSCYHGSHAGIPSFEQVRPNYDGGYVFLHSHFLEGEQAKEYIKLFMELCDRGNWKEVRDQLQARAPLYFEDMVAVNLEWRLSDAADEVIACASACDREGRSYSALFDDLIDAHGFGREHIPLLLKILNERTEDFIFEVDEDELYAPPSQLEEMPGMSMS